MTTQNPCDRRRAGRTPIMIPIVVGAILLAAVLWALHGRFSRPAETLPVAELAPGLEQNLLGERTRSPLKPVKPEPAPARVEPAPPPVVATESQPPLPERRQREKTGGTQNMSPSELLAWIKATDTIADFGKKKVLLVELGRELAAENFGNALSLAGGVSDPLVRNWLYEGMFALHSLAHPAAALQAAQALDPLKSSVVSEARYREMKKDFDTAMLAVMGGWAASDPTAALDYVSQIPQDIMGKAMITVYGVWGQSDPAAAFEKAKEVTGGIQAPLYQALFSGWAKRDAAEAARYAATLEDTSLLPKIYAGIAEGFLSTWDQVNPRATADWAVDVFPKGVLDHVLPDMYLRWAQTDAMGAAQHALQLNRSYAFDLKSTLGNILQQWSESNIDQAVQWMDQSFERDEDYMWAVSSLIETMRYKNPAKTAELLEQVPFTFAEGTEGAQEVDKLLAFWSRKDSAAAAAWVEGLQNRDLKIIAVKTLAANWTSRNYDEALAWGRSITDPDMKAYALSNVALRQALHGVQRSDDWIQELPEGFVQTRTAAGFILGSMLRAKDQSAAERVKQQLSADALDVSALSQIVDESSLDAETKSQLVRLLD